MDEIRIIEVDLVILYWVRYDNLPGIERIVYIFRKQTRAVMFVFFVCIKRKRGCRNVLVGQFESRQLNVVRRRAT